MLWFQSSNGMAILHPKIPINLLLLLRIQEFSSIWSTTFSHNWTSAKAASAGVPTSWPAVFAIRFVQGGTLTLSSLSLTSRKPSIRAGWRPPWCVRGSFSYTPHCILRFFVHSFEVHALNTFSLFFCHFCPPFNFSAFLSIFSRRCQNRTPCYISVFFLSG